MFLFYFCCTFHKSATLFRKMISIRLPGLPIFKQKRIFTMYFAGISADSSSFHKFYFAKPFFLVPAKKRRICIHRHGVFSAYFTYYRAKPCCFLQESHLLFKQYRCSAEPRSDEPGTSPGSQSRCRPQRRLHSRLHLHAVPRLR